MHIMSSRRTFFNYAALLVQHTLHLTASHIRQPGLLHEGLAPVEAGAVGQVGPYGDQEANVVLTQTWGRLDGRRS